jgi:hypothetical protein
MIWLIFIIEGEKRATEGAGGHNPIFLRVVVYMLRAPLIPRNMKSVGIGKV